MIFVISLAESFALKLDKTVCPEIFLLLKLDFDNLPYAEK